VIAEENMSTEEKVSKFIELFSAIPDERQEWKVKHKLVDIIFIAVVATLADCDDWEEIEWFAKLKKDWFKKYLELPNGIPSHDTTERVFSWIDPVLFGKAFRSWIKLAVGTMPKGVVPIDGKTMRGTKDTEKKALHVVNAWSGENKMILGQVFTDEKSNEMKAIPRILDILDTAGQIVTIDAGGTYKDIAEKVIGKGGDYVLALKKNQPTLFEEVKLFFESEIEESKLKAKRNDYNIQSISKPEKGHGRIERRTYFMTDNIDWLSSKEEWSGLRSIGMVHTRTEKVSTGAVSEEDRYFISSLPCEVSRFAYAVRQHWGVESMHWSLDMTFNEDRRRSRKNNSAKNLAGLIRIAYNIIKSDGVPKRMPIKRLRKQALVDDEYLERLISSVF
jgi:predicted transposase YbfD/YdcC